MNKSVLVLETPSNCRKCPLRYDSYGQCEVCIVKDEVVNSFYETNTKPNWCPLKELPKEKDWDEVPYETDCYSYLSGWNGCLDKILGE